MIDRLTFRVADTVTGSCFISTFFDRHLVQFFWKRESWIRSRFKCLWGPLICKLICDLNCEVRMWCEVHLRLCLYFSRSQRIVYFFPKFFTRQICESMQMRSVISADRYSQIPKCRTKFFGTVSTENNREKIVIPPPPPLCMKFFDTRNF